MRRPEFHEWQPPRRGRRWPLALASVLAHLLLVLPLVLKPRLPEVVEAEEPARPREPDRAVEMLYLPPQAPAPAPPPPAPQAPPAPEPPQVATNLPKPPVQEQQPEERPNAPPEAERRDGTEEPPADAETAPRGGQPAAAPPPAPKEENPFAKALAERAAQESEAKRIFGRKRKAPVEGEDYEIRPWNVSTPGRSDCIPVPKFPRDSLGRAPMGVAAGRIFREDNGRPLPGAHLQMLGTAYSTFTEDDGSYRLSYDLSLVEDCRTQWVRVSADGYESRLLVLLVGQNIRSEDVRLRRR